MRWWAWLLALIVIVAAGYALVNRCADGSAMGGRYRTCACRGIEWVQEDRTAADGPRRTLCLGLIAATTCYRSRGGEVVTCY